MKKTPTIIVSVIIVAVIAFFAINSYYKNLAGKAAITPSNTCYFGDINGDCVTTLTEVTFAKDLTSLKSPTGCFWKDTNICKKTLDADGSGAITISDVNILKEWVSLKKVNESRVLGAPGKINFIQAPQYITNLTPFPITLQVLTRSGLPSAMTGVTIGSETRFTDINGTVKFTITPTTIPYTTRAYIPKNAAKSVPTIIESLTINDICAEAIPGHNNLNEKRINIVFVGINYNDINIFISHVNDSIDYDGNGFGILSVEPFKSNKNKFNFFYVNEIGNITFNTSLSAIGRSYQTRTKALELSSMCNLPKKDIINLINSDSVRTFADIDDDLSYVGFSDTYCIEDNNRCVAGVVHEFAHQFGPGIFALADDYVSDLFGNEGIPVGNTTITFSAQFYDSPYTNCSEYCSQTKDGKLLCGNQDLFEVCLPTIESFADCEANAPWRDFIGNGCGSEGVVDCTEIQNESFCGIDSETMTNKCTTYPKKSPKNLTAFTNLSRVDPGLMEVDCFYPAHTGDYYKSVHITIMAGAQAPFSFGQYYERILCNIIKQTTGSAGGVCDTLCLDGCPAGKKCIRGKCSFVNSS